MDSIRNLKDAGSLLPAWTTPLVLTIGIMGLLLFAQNSIADQPHALVKQGTLFAVFGSAIMAVLILAMSIMSAKPGKLRTAISDGFVRGLNFVWATSSVALVAFVGAKPAYAAMTEHLATTLAGAVALAVMGAAYFISRTKPQGAPSVDPVSGLHATTALAIPQAFVETKRQVPSFQVSLADLTRLTIHQAGRILGYHGSNCLLADNFSADLDVNARTARIFSDMNLIQTPQLVHWRLHMLMMGSAAEFVIRKTGSDAAMDDIHAFDALAAKYLSMSMENTIFANPTNEQEAALKAARVSMLRRQVWSRCVGACEANSKVLLQLVRSIRSQSCLSYGDLKHILDEVEMPAGFPVAAFDTDDLMERTMLAIEHVSSDEFEPVDEPQAEPAPTVTQEAASRVERVDQETHPSAQVYQFNA